MDKTVLIHASAGLEGNEIEGIGGPAIVVWGMSNAVAIVGNYFASDDEGFKDANRDGGCPSYWPDCIGNQTCLLRYIFVDPATPFRSTQTLLDAGTARLFCSRTAMADAAVARGTSPCSPTWL